MNAGKEKLGRADALQLAKSAARIIVAKGKKITTFDMAGDPPDDKTLLSALLGPTGNLRAPAIRCGKTLIVGYNEELFQEAFS